jgi:hypothetical protein
MSYLPAAHGSDVYYGLAYALTVRKTSSERPRYVA